MKQPTKTLSAKALVGTLCRMMHMNMATIAMIAGVQPKNMTAWIAGKRRALRLSSIVAILNAIGIQINAGRTVLDPGRVHFWDLTLPMVGPSRRGLQPLLELARILAGGEIAEVRPASRRGSVMHGWFHRYFMIAGSSSRGVPFRVVVCLHTWPWRRVRLTPEMIPGACWRDCVQQTLRVCPSAWQGVVGKDMTTDEYVRAFEALNVEFDWEHVALMAREAGLTPDDIAEYILASQRKPDQTNTTPEETTDGPVPVKLLLFSNAAEAA